MTENKAETVNSSDTNQENLKQDFEKITNYVINLSHDLKNVKDSLENATQVLAALLKTVDEGRILNTNNIQDCLISIRVTQLDNMIKKHVGAGLLKPSVEVKKNSVVLCKQSNSDGNEINRKISLPISDMRDEIKTLFVGKKANELVIVEEPVETTDDHTKMTKNIFQILEIYDVSEKLENSFL